MRSLIIASLLCSPVLLCAMEAPAKTTTQIEKDVKGLTKSQVKAYFGRKPDKALDSVTWYYKVKVYDPDAETHFTYIAVTFRQRIGEDYKCKYVHFLNK